MQAIQIKKTGDTSVLEYVTLPTPAPKAGEALVRIKAAGLNFIDIYMRKGQYPREMPFTPGFEASGIVEAIGPDVTAVKVGDRVAYTNVLGSYAEYITISANMLIPLPNEISFEQGAAFPLQGITAQYLLHEFHTIKPKDKVLVHAAAGGMGLLLVQWLKHLGAEVYGTVSTDEKAKMAKLAGADHIINYTTHDFAKEIMRMTNDVGVDYIIDGVGKTTFTKNLDAIKIHGHICLYGSASGPADPLQPNALQAKAVTISGGSIFCFINSRDELLMRANMVMQGIKEGWLKLNLDSQYALKDVAAAHQKLESRGTSGKVILTVE